MRYYIEDNLQNFKFWGGAIERSANLSGEQFDTIEEIMESIEPEDGWSDTAINDFFWFEFDMIATWIGYKNEEYYNKGITNNEISEANDWYWGLGEDEKMDRELLEEAEINPSDYEDDETGEVDKELIETELDAWWENLEDDDKVGIYIKYE